MGNKFREDFMQALYEMRRAFLKNNLPVPKEIVLDGGFEMGKNIFNSLTPTDYNDPYGRRNLYIGVEIMGIKVRVDKTK